MEPKPASRMPILVWLFASQLLAIATLFFWLFAAGIFTIPSGSSMAQAAPSVAFAVWAYPVWPIAFTIAAWVAYARKNDKLAAVLTTLTFLPVLVLIVFIMLSGLAGPGRL